MDKILAFLTLTVAIVISSVAAYYSTSGMMKLFAATPIAIAIMMISLEGGKVVVTTWLHSKWKNSLNPFFKIYLCLAVTCLMSITALGTYGFLAGSHLEQSAPIAGIDIQVAQLETQLQQKQAENGQLQKRQDQISRITDKTLETSGRSAFRIANSQKTEAASIQKRIDDVNKQINDINTKLVPLKTQGAAVEAKLGPVKYVAQLFGWTDPEYAVRIIIVLIMIAFDPLALSLFIAGSISLRDLREKRESTKQSDTEPKDQNPILPRAENDDLDLARAEFEDDLKIKNSTVDQRLENLQQAEQVVLESVTAMSDYENSLKEEREQLSNWEANLREQQQVINNWTPPVDDRDPKDKIIEMLERHPAMINEIIDEVQALQPPKRHGL